MRVQSSLWMAGVGLVTVASPALAQNAPATETKPTAVEEIVVTGTFIRGIAPTGNQVIGITAEDVEASGAMSTKDLLAEVPQISNFFNNINGVGVTNNAGPGTVNQGSVIQVQRPTLRNIGSNTTGSFPTLILMDGHRLVGAGVNQSSPDVGLIPPGAIERVEVFTDGGSALYGTDAVGGVINFITRNRFDGVQVGGRYGIGDGFTNYDANLTAGTDWGSGSVFGAVAYNEGESFFGRDTDWNRAINWNESAPFGQYLQGSERRCAAPNVTASGANYPVTSPSPTFGAANTFNFCDAQANQTLAPEQTSESVFAGLTQQLTENLELSVAAQWAHRESTNFAGAHLGTVSVTPANPVYRPIAAAPGVNHTVNFDYSPFSGVEDNSSLIDLETWNFTPSLRMGLPGDWQANLLLNYGESETFFRNNAVNATRQATYLARGELNPYNVLASAPGVLADIHNWQRYGFADQSMAQARVVVDGPLFKLPGGEVRAALGVEYLKEEIDRREGFTNRGAENTLPLLGIDRDVKAVFAEVNVPIFGPDNRLPVMDSLTLSLSGRYDEYSDFGDTTNPQVGLIWGLTDWFRLRGNWGESFQAPSPIEVLLQNFQTVQLNPIIFQYPGAVTQAGDVKVDGTPLTPGTPILTQGQYQALFGVSPSNSVALNGALPDLQPQTGESWSIGFDLEMPFLRELRVGATYYNVAFENTLFSFQNSVFVQQATTYTNFSEYIFINGVHGTGPNNRFSAADIARFCGQATNPTTCAANPDTIYQLVDVRFDNRGGSKEEGIDLDVRYSHPFGWGTLDAGASGNYRLKSENQSAATGLFTETNLNNISRYQLTANVGATIGAFYTRATLRHADGYELTFNGGQPVTPTSVGPFQDSVDAFDLVDLFFRYQLSNLGPREIQLSLNVANVFDEDPPLFRQSNSSSSANGTTLGRMFTVGFTVDF